MKKELSKLYNQLKKAGLDSYAYKVASIYRNAGEMDYDSGNMPKPTLAPVEQPDINHPVFNSDASTTDYCKALKKAALNMFFTYRDLDKFYAAATKFGEVVNNTNPKGIRVLIPPKHKVRMDFDKYGSFQGHFFRKAYYEYDKKGVMIRDSIPREQDDILRSLDTVVNVISGDHGFSIGHNKIADLVLYLGYDKNCIKEIYTAPFRAEARPNDPNKFPSTHEVATRRFFDDYIIRMSKDVERDAESAKGHTGAGVFDADISEYSRLFEACMSNDDDAFDANLEELVLKANPNIDNFGRGIIMRNAHEHMVRLRNHIASSDKSGVEATEEFMADIERMAKRF